MRQLAWLTFVACLFSANWVGAETIYLKPRASATTQTETISQKTLNQFKQNCLRGSDRDCPLFFINSPVRTSNYWSRHPAEGDNPPILGLTDELLEYLVINNRNYREKPAQVKVSDNFKKDLIEAFREIPEKIRNGIRKHFFGFVLVKNLGSSAMSLDIYEPVKSRDKMPYGLVVLDADKLQRKANEWITWKEQSPFRADPLWWVEVEVENPENNNRKNALQMVILHELGHIWSFRHQIVPRDWMDYEKLTSGSFPFLDISWRYEESAITSKAKQPVPFYANPELQLSASEIPEIYKKMSTSSFTTLYASTNSEDDFAESFATYVHTVLMKKPYRILVKKAGKTVQTISTCWGEARCKEKQALLENILEKNDLQGQHW